jgi:hypothetical protein
MDDSTGSTFEEILERDGVPGRGRVLNDGTFWKPVPTPERGDVDGPFMCVENTRQFGEHIYARWKRMGHS